MFYFILTKGGTSGLEKAGFWFVDGVDFTGVLHVIAPVDTTSINHSSNKVQN